MKKTVEKILRAALFSGLKSGKAEIKLILMRAGAKFWKNDQIFSRIYQTNEWGGSNGELFSGSGSYEQPIEPRGGVHRRERWSWLLKF
jgi:hypothetical protein